MHASETLSSLYLYPCPCLDSKLTSNCVHPAGREARPLAFPSSPLKRAARVRAELQQPNRSRQHHVSDPHWLLRPGPGPSGCDCILPL